MDDWMKYLVAFILGYLLHKMTRGNGFSIDIADDVCPKHISEFIEKRNMESYTWPDLFQVLKHGKRLQGICAMKKGDTRYNANSESKCNQNKDTMTWCKFHPEGNFFSKPVSAGYLITGALTSFKTPSRNRPADINGTYLKTKKTYTDQPVYQRKPIDGPARYLYFNSTKSAWQVSAQMGGDEVRIPTIKAQLLNGNKCQNNPDKCPEGSWIQQDPAWMPSQTVASDMTVRAI